MSDDQRIRHYLPPLGEDYPEDVAVKVNKGAYKKPMSDRDKANANFKKRLKEDREAKLAKAGGKKSSYKKVQEVPALLRGGEQANHEAIKAVLPTPAKDSLLNKNIK